MRAIHWLRSRQESRSLSYWLSFVYFDTKDRSLNNWMYLAYLVVFFGVWWFAVLAWFAKAGATLLTMFSPVDPGGLVIALYVTALLVWFVVSFYQAVRRSPVVFSEDDSLLICQMPLKPQKVVIRWMVMPWVKSLLPFILLGLVLGFSLADASMIPDAGMSQAFAEYAGMGTRAVLMIVPLHLVVFTITWAVGIWFMNHQRHKKALFWVLSVFLIFLMVFISGITVMFGNKVPNIFQPFSNLFPYFLKVGFGRGDISEPLVVSWLAGAFSLVVLFLISKQFSLGLAAQETKERSKIANLKRYGFSGQAQEIRDQHRLGLEKRTAWNPAWTGGQSILWKGILQYTRTIRFSDIYDLLFFVSSSIGLVYLPNIGGRILVILTWVLKAGQFLTSRLRQDLTHWTVVKQLPVKPRQWILYDLLLPSCLIFSMSAIGIYVGSLLTGRPALGEVLALPGMIAGIAGISAYEIFKNSEVSLLVKGQAPGVSELGVIIGTVGAGIPVVIYSMLPGLAGAIIAFLAALIIGGLALSAALKAYRMIQ